MSRASAPPRADISLGRPLLALGTRPTHHNPPRRTRSQRAADSAAIREQRPVPAPSPLGASPAAPAPAPTRTLSPDDNNDPRAGDLLNALGSDSSSSAPSVFSAARSNMSYPGRTPSSYALTPLTSTDSSPPGKPSSPPSAKPPHATAHAQQADRNTPSTAPSIEAAAMTPVHTPSEARIPTRPTDGIMGKIAVYDPYLTPKDVKRAAKIAPRYRDIIEKDDPLPPPDPRLAIAGYTSGSYNVPLKSNDQKAHKFKYQPAPQIAKPFVYDARISCGPDPATQVVVTGFDPLTLESQIRGFFTSFGEVESVKNQVHPDNGSPLGVCLVKFRDTPASRKVPSVPASTSAKRAETEGTRQRIGLCEVKVQLDREGRRCSKYVNSIVEQSRAHQAKLKAKLAPASVAPIAPNLADLPANVPKGPSGKGNGMRPPVRMQAPLPPPRKGPSAVEIEPIKPQMRRTPYLFIAHQHVPVMSATIEHLQRRMKSCNWSGIRCDRSGYFITFPDSKRGEDTAVKCYREFNGAPLFTYFMVMECNQYGDPDYERSLSPQPVVAITKRKTVEDMIAQEEEEDLELEKKDRAEALHPVAAAIEILKHEFQEKLLGDIKTRIAGPALLDFMAPELHQAKRRKLNVSDPQCKDEARLPTLIVPGLDSTVAGVQARAPGFPGGRSNRRALGPYDPNRVRGRKPLQPVNVYGDDRRKKTAPKRNNIRGLHHALLMRDEEKDSDDEGRSTFTRDTEEQDSRPISRAPSISPSTDAEEEESSRAHRAKRRRIEAGWGEDSDDEMMDDSHARSLLAHLIHKDPENMAEKELEQVLAILPRSSPIWKKANQALKGFRKLRLIQQEADAIFGVETSAADNKHEVEMLIAQEDEVVKPLPTTEVEPTKPKRKPGLAKKRKTKKQLEEEAKAAQAEISAVARELKDVPITEDSKEVSPMLIFKDAQGEERVSVNFKVSTDYPRPTVEDDPSVVMDIDGWQELLKDNEDLAMLRKALEHFAPAKIGDAHTWAWKQKQIKHLNRPGEAGVSRTETKIEGYYVPNPTGCARTEGIKKIKESEKSKYLPHRIRVQEEREERERRATNEERTTTVVEGFKFNTGTKQTSTSNSRANRANNRRLVNDINISKTMSGAEGDAMRFNQLKKRKKLVKFDRSAIHNWGLYAQESISANDMIIEYVGEKVRQRVADQREAKYDLQGVGSSYLFRIDEDTVIDATKMGGIARFINHSCTPNCTAKIIRVDGTKRIVIYALRDISQDEELTYDYKFAREADPTDRIPCLCGSVGCKGFLN